MWTLTLEKFCKHAVKTIFSRIKYYSFFFFFFFHLQVSHSEEKQDSRVANVCWNQQQQLRAWNWGQRRGSQSSLLDFASAWRRVLTQLQLASPYGPKGGSPFSSSPGWASKQGGVSAPDLDEVPRFHSQVSRQLLAWKLRPIKKEGELVAGESHSLLVAGHEGLERRILGGEEKNTDVKQ